MTRIVLGALIASLLASAARADEAKYWLFVGTYTGADSKGIYRCEFDPRTGQVGEPELAAETPNPSFLAVHPSGKFLYAVNEVSEFKGEKTGSVSAFALDPQSGELELLNVKPSKGTAPCHISIDAKGKAALVANYGSGSVASLPIGDDGRLGDPASAIQHEGTSADPRRQEGPHGHSINLDEANRFAVAADLGLDKLLVYRFDPETAEIKPNDPPSTSVEPGSGPRHFAFHPDGRHAYAINEMASTVTALDYDPQAGTLKPVQTITTLPEDFEGNNSTADIHVHPNGRFVYGSNRGHDSIAVFEINREKGTLTPKGYQPTAGQTPRNFAIDPTGRFLLAANQETGNIVSFEIDPDRGTLVQARPPVGVPEPVCLVFVAKPE